MEDVFGTGNDLTEPGDDELGIGEGAEQTGAGPGLPDDGGDDGDDGGIDTGGGREEHPQGRAFRTMRETLAARDREIARLREVELRATRYEERMRMLTEQRQRDEAMRRAAAEAEAARRQAAENPEPNKEEDPIGWNEWRIQQLEQRLNGQAEANQRAQQEQIQQHRIQTINRIAGEYTAWENRFSLERPDYVHAFNHVAGYYAHQYRLRGVAEENIIAALEQERARLIQDCLQIDAQNGTYQWVRNPAAVIYQMAQALGYGGPPQQQQEGDGFDVAPAQQAAPRRDPRAERLGRSVAAARANGAAGRSGGTARSNQWTLERFNELSEAEAARFMEQYPELAQEILSPNG